MKAIIPVYDIESVSECQQDSILIERFASYYHTHKDLYKLHRHNFYHLILFTEGRGTHSIDFETFTIKPFQIYFMMPGQVHSWNFGGRVDGYVVNFSSDLFQSFLLRPDFIEDFNFFRGEAGDSVIQIPIDQQDRLLGLFEELIRENDESSAFTLTMIRLILIKIFVLVSRLNPNTDAALSSSYNYMLLKNFQKLIGQNYRTLKLPKDYAELLYITPNHLNALCNDLLGLSAGEVIRNRVFLEAKRLLINPELSISKISDLLNFTDNSYFTKAFKRHVGLKPEEFRKTQQLIQTKG